MRGAVAPVFLKIFACLSKTVFDELAMAGEDSARRRQLHAMRGTVYEAYAEFGLAFSDLLADGGLRPTHVAGGGRERAKLFDGPQGH